MSRVVTKLAALVAVLALAAAACGSDGGGDAAPVDDAAAPADEAPDDAEPDDAAPDDAAAPVDDAAEAPADDAAAPVDDDAEAPADDAAAPAGAVSTGPADPDLEPVRIGLLNQENDPIGSFPEARQGAEGAVGYINAELNGIDGHPVELVVCTQASVEEAQACTQELATAGVVSVINMVNIWTFAFDFYGTLGDTPVVGGLPLFATDYDAPNARYFNGGSVSVYAAMARWSVEQFDVKKVAVLENSNPAASAATEIGLLPIYEQFGVEVVRITVPQPATDVAPQVSEAADVDADLILVLTSGFECPLITTAAGQFGIPPEKMVYSTTCTGEDVLDQVGDQMVGSYVHRGGYTEDDPWAPPEAIEAIERNLDLIPTWAPDAPDGGLTPLGFATVLDVELLYDEIGFDGLTADNILATMDDGSPRGLVGGFGWACVYADIGLQSVCGGENLFVQLLPDLTTVEPSSGLVNGLTLLE